LLEEIQKRFNGVGSIREGSKNELVYSVTGLNQIIEEIIPFIDRNPLYSERQNHYEKFRKVSLILKKEIPLSKKSQLDNMNKEGKHRRLSKTEYLAMVKDKLPNFGNSENNFLKDKDK
jgi:hypothetical protein